MRPSVPMLRSSALVVAACLALGTAVHPQTNEELQLRADELRARRAGAIAEAVRRGLVTASELQSEAEQGDAQSQYLLGVMYADGIGVEQDAAEAARWLRLAEEQGHAKAQAELVTLALQWEAERGDVEAQMSLGFRYWFGLDGEKDLIKAARWYRLAAEQGNADAQYRLGWFYIVGDGVQRDFEEGIRWYRLAAENGSKQAIEDLERAWACFKSDRNHVLVTLTWADHENPALRVGRVSVAGTSYVSGFELDGLNLRWNFGPDNEFVQDDGNYAYSFVIWPDGTGRYYDFSRSTDGAANPSQTYKCEVAAER